MGRDNTESKKKPHVPFATRLAQGTAEWIANKTHHHNGDSRVEYNKDAFDKQHIGHAEAQAAAKAAEAIENLEKTALARLIGLKEESIQKKE